MVAVQFTPPPLRSDLDPGTVHVWAVPLTVGSEARDRAHRLLSRDEKERAARFRRPLDRDRYAVSRAALRMVLGSYLERPPVRIAFRYGPAGKPACATQAGGRPLFFNLSHAGDLALIAVSRDGAVGIDVERIDRAVAGEALLAALLPTGHERPAEPLEPDDFFARWVRLEAYLKMRGDGFGQPLSRQAALLLQPRPTAAIPCFTAGPDGCRVFEFTLPGPFAACLCAAPGATTARFFNGDHLLANGDAGAAGQSNRQREHVCEEFA